MKERGAGARREVNWVLISRTREGMEVEEEEGGDGEVGERANTGTAQRNQVKKREKSICSYKKISLQPVPLFLELSQSEVTVSSGM